MRRVSGRRAGVARGVIRGHPRHVARIPATCRPGERDASRYSLASKWGFLRAISATISATRSARIRPYSTLQVGQRSSARSASSATVLVDFTRFGRAVPLSSAIPHPPSGTRTLLQSARALGSSSHAAPRARAEQAPHDAASDAASMGHAEREQADEMSMAERPASTAPRAATPQPTGSDRRGTLPPHPHSVEPQPGSRQPMPHGERDGRR